MFTRSKATVYVNDIVSGALSVLSDISSKTTSKANLENVISIEGCTGVNFKHINLEQVFNLDLSSFKNLTSNITATQLEDAMVKASSQAASSSGLGGFSIAESTSVTNSVHELATQLTSSIKTNLTRLGREEMDVLTRHGGALVEARIRRYAPELIGA